MRTLVSLNPADVDAALQLVRFLYEAKQDHAAAREELNLRIGGFGDTTRYQVAVAELDFAEGNRGLGKRRLEALLADETQSEWMRISKIALTRMYMAERDFAPAQSLVDGLISNSPTDVEAIGLRASIYLEQAQPQAATVIVLKALLTEPPTADLMRILAVAYERSAHIALADKAFSDALRLSGQTIEPAMEYVDFATTRTVRASGTRARGPYR